MRRVCARLFGPATIADGGSSPYPATIAVSTDRTIVEDVNVRVRQIAHSFTDSLDLLLVGPGGQNVMLLSDAGESGPVPSDTITFDDEAAEPVPDLRSSATQRRSQCWIASLRCWTG